MLFSSFQRRDERDDGVEKRRARNAFWKLRREGGQNEVFMTGDICIIPAAALEDIYTRRFHASEIPSTSSPNV